MVDSSMIRIQCKIVWIRTTGFQSTNGCIFFILNYWLAGEKIWWFIKKKSEYKVEEVGKQGKRGNFHCIWGKKWGGAKISIILIIYTPECTLSIAIEEQTHLHDIFLLYRARHLLSEIKQLINWSINIALCGQKINMMFSTKDNIDQVIFQSTYSMINFRNISIFFKKLNIIVNYAKCFVCVFLKSISDIKICFWYMKYEVRFKFFLFLHFL